MMRQKAKRNEKRELSSVGSERLPYKQRVGGSTPSAPTNGKQVLYKANDSFLPCARNASDETVATSAVVRIEDAKHDAAEGKKKRKKGWFRASALQAEGRGFDSLSSHHPKGQIKAKS